MAHKFSSHLKFYHDSHAFAMLGILQFDKNDISRTHWRIHLDFVHVVVVLGNL